MATVERPLPERINHAAAALKLARRDGNCEAIQVAAKRVDALLDEWMKQKGGGDGSGA